MKTKISSSWKYFGIEDEIGLLSQIYDGFTFDTKEIEIACITSDEDQKIVDNNEFLCGIKNLTTLSLFKEYKVLQFNKSLDSSKKAKNNTLKIYKAKINWNNLPRLTAYLHDKEAIKPYGEQKQQEILCRLIIKESIKQKQSRFLINEEILGEYTANGIDYNTFSHEKSPARNVRFLTTILSLEDLNMLDIIQSSFHFDSQSRTIKMQSEFSLSFFANPQKICLPAAHCLLFIELSPKTIKFTDQFPNKSLSNIRGFIDKFISHSQSLAIKVNYDSQNAILNIKNKTVVFSSNTNQDYLLRVLFSTNKDLFRKWSWDEIIEHDDWGDEECKDDKELWKTIYNASCEINKKVEEKTGIKDFLTTKPVSTVQINTTFLSIS